jgi:hypothetical protein
VAEIQLLLSKSIPELDVRGELSHALVNIVGRYGEMVIDRLNKAPERNFLAFLDLLGVSAQPAQPARVPITFYLSANSIESAVPAGTQIAAEPAKGEQNPVIFETEHALSVISAKLESLLLRDADRDRYLEYDAIIPQGPPAEPAGLSTATLPSTFGGKAQPIPHELYVGFEMYPHWPAHNQLSLDLVLEQGATKPDPRALQWEICTSTPGVQAITIIPLLPEADGTESLTKTGRIVFKDVAEFNPAVIEGVSNQWLRCRLMTPITHSASFVEGMVRTVSLPRVRTLTMGTQFEQKNLRVEQAFSNTVKLDTSKDFFPFGERPKFGDSFYFASPAAFSNPDALVTCEITLTNPATGGPDLPIPPVKARNTQLQWEFWDGTVWEELGASDLTTKSEIKPRVIIIDKETPITEEARFSDRTRSLSVSGVVTFSFSRPPALIEINGQKSYWVRVRIVSGDYGEEAHYEQDHAKGGHLVPASFAPPSIHSINLSYTVNKSFSPKAFLTYNDFIYRHVDPGGSFVPFTPPSAGTPPILYFGFTLPAPAASRAAALPLSQAELHGSKFPSRVSIYVSVAELQWQDMSAYDEQTVIAWEYWNGRAWTKWTVRDDTIGLRRSGLIRVLAPPDFALKKEFGRERYWFRLRQVQANFAPALRRVIMNTTTALHSVTLQKEVLGASNGQPLQRFKTTHKPVLDRQQLEVREPTAPSFEEQSRIQDEEGDDAIRPADGVNKSEVWVRWHQVPNFYGSRPRDRHYMLDRATGEVTFGDGSYGLIPSVLPGNIRMAQYRTGGGESGNKPPFSVKQLKTAIPYIDKTFNWEQAAGGTDEESTDSLLSRGPRILRHGSRAVTAEDFEDLAALASPEVSRAKCVPMIDLKRDPDSRRRVPGIVSVIVVPRSLAPRPIPSIELLDRVHSFLDASRSAAVASTDKLIIVPPEYVSIDVDVEIAVDDPDTINEVELRVTQALDDFFHPLTGGPDDSGWDFGRLPHRSDLFPLIEGIPGVSHVRKLQILPRVDRQGADKTTNFLICCGRHEVAATLEE